MTEEDWNWNFTDFLTDNSRFNSSCPQRDQSRCLNERTQISDDLIKTDQDSDFSNVL